MKRKRCKTCKRPWPVRYKRPIYGKVVLALAELYRIAHNTTTEWVFTPDEDSTKLFRLGDFSKLRFWKLTRMSRKRGVGWWRVTKRGEQFLHGEIEVPPWILLQKNRIVKRSKRRISIKQVFKNRADRVTWKEIKPR